MYALAVTTGTTVTGTGIYTVPEAAHLGKVTPRRIQFHFISVRITNASLSVDNVLNENFFALIEARLQHGASQRGTQCVPETGRSHNGIGADATRHPFHATQRRQLAIPARCSCRWNLHTQLIAQAA